MRESIKLLYSAKSQQKSKIKPNEKKDLQSRSNQVKAITSVIGVSRTLSGPYFSKSPLDIYKKQKIRIW